MPAEEPKLSDTNACAVCYTVTDPNSDCNCDGCTHTYCPCHAECNRHAYPDGLAHPDANPDTSGDVGTAA